MQTAPAARRQVSQRWVVVRPRSTLTLSFFSFFLFKILIMQSCLSLAWPALLSGGVVPEGHGNIDVRRVNGMCESGGA